MNPCSCNCCSGNCNNCSCGSCANALLHLDNRNVLLHSLCANSNRTFLSSPDSQKSRGCLQLKNLSIVSNSTDRTDRGAIEMAYDN
ncbi:hypothetical protein CPSG_06216 [Coccidioides posadasii str. Silveira]|uniref:Uncharacterized protein n=1 Tax=Coccidioides posadasii (strain RMSCC 757 / Silveira) TaxID=443226 RepID=E9D8R4_COCPS|nr:hypothetical protein CPSG_06216 [Coccidioides posadasii str. Silveira]